MSCMTRVEFEVRRQLHRDTVKYIAWRKEMSLWDSDRELQKILLLIAAQTNLGPFKLWLDESVVPVVYNTEESAVLALLIAGPGCYVTDRCDSILSYTPVITDLSDAWQLTSD